MTGPPIAAWGYDGPLQTLAGGHRNAVFRGGNLVFKSTRRSEAALLWMQDVHAAARRSGFVVPDMVAGADGFLVQHGWTCEQFIDGDGLPSRDLADVLPMVRAFHRATRDVAQRPGFLASYDLILMECGGDVDVSGIPADVVALCRAAWASLAERPRGVVHGDLNPTNMIRCFDGRIALVDWDECRRDVVDFDLYPLAGGRGLLGCGARPCPAAVSAALRR